jgi:nucleoside-triphosphatase THEP1
MKKVGNKVFIITGEQGAGKTTCLVEVIGILEKKGIGVRGFFARGYWSDGLRSGFDLVNVKTNEKHILCRNYFDEGDQKFGRFYFKPSTIKTGNTILNPSNKSTDELMVIDEIGLFEIQGKLWSDSFSRLLKDQSAPILITVRTNLVEPVIAHFKLSNTYLFKCTESPIKIAESLSDMLI